MLLFNSSLAYAVLQKVSIKDKFEAKWNDCVSALCKHT